MRPGPSLDALAGLVSVGVRVSSWRGGECIADDLPVWDVKVEATTERVVPSKLTLMADPMLVPTAPHDPLANFGQRLHVVALVEADGVETRVPVGWYLIQSWEEREQGVQVEAVDLFQMVVDDPAAWPSSPPEGATLLSEVQRLTGSSVAVGHTLPVVLDVPDRVISRNFQWGTSKAEAIRDLCGSLGLSYGVKPDGCLHVWQTNRAIGPVVVYSARNLLVGASRQSRDRIANRWVVCGSPQGDESTKWSATRTNFTDDYAPTLYGVVTDRREFNAATSADAVEKAATTYMRNTLNARGVRSLQIAMDPRLEIGDLILAEIEHEDGNTERILGLVRALSATFDDPAQVMRIDVEEQAW